MVWQYMHLCFLNIYLSHISATAKLPPSQPPNPHKKSKKKKKRKKQTEIYSCVHFIWIKGKQDIRPPPYFTGVWKVQFFLFISCLRYSVLCPRYYRVTMLYYLVTTIQLDCRIRKLKGINMRVHTCGEKCAFYCD